ncbi:MAG TPA: hypothetical protein VKG44_06655 [Candidatus Baltobacteraceae bacterium]|nr:hypothetical protein [Candidatus Baltobacteraceae bacterium]
MFLATRALGALALASSLLGPAGAAAAANDSRPLTPGEQATLLPLVCSEPRAAAHGETQCSSLIGYPGSNRSGGRFGLTAIIVFTRAGLDQAYATYSSANESHANNFGGGVLFAHSDARWKLLKWFPGRQMDPCVAVPGGRGLKMLCSSGWGGQGENDTSVWVSSIPPSAGNAASDAAGDVILQAEDTRGMGGGVESGCEYRVPKGQVMLLSIDSLTRTGSTPYFAKAQVTYLTAADIASACNGSHTQRVRETKASIQFREQNGRVTVATPLAFSKLPG